MMELKKRNGKVEESDGSESDNKMLIGVWGWRVACQSGGDKFGSFTKVWRGTPSEMPKLLWI